ncbi:TRAP-type C4-dicarboxylate transport system substrate-binding protein [Paracoccus pantotrophus]|uniref:C4-dicarboxylate ABC transporter n=1 Tax=Paracoccus pantotrophus TaxID=82367 RepID=A0AAE6TWI0_PARPN|nr:C4-dicarboxylate TRAP transporter substrate-binding protein [Paracoccus pantotrophus]QFG37335.1 C4-dicarboxylate ABC transporter [Paracoccus pantotrophus]RKS52227.1 TRAP-type C4-dicarboxylate transport system substrate-binding protein [Paracoccus pantotrophus]
MSLMKKLGLGAAMAVALALPGLAADVTVKVAYENNPGEPVDVLMNKWAELVAERSEGAVALELYPSSQLGSKEDIIEQAKMGVNVITIADAGFLIDYDADLGILYGPYLTEDAQDLFRLYEGDWFQEKHEVLKSHGIRIVIPNYMYGTRHILAKKKIETPADMAGLKIRTPNNNMQIKAIELMGGTPTPMPLGDVYPALTQGVIDGVENPLTVLHGQKLDEQAKQLSLVGYLTNTAFWLGGEAYLSSLDPEVLTVLEETGYEIGLESQKAAAADEARALEGMKAQGVEVISPDVEAFREITKPFYTQFPEWSEGLYDRIQAEIAG